MGKLDVKLAGHEVGIALLRAARHVQRERYGADQDDRHAPAADRRQLTEPASKGKAAGTASNVIRHVYRCFAERRRAYHILLERRP